MSMTDPTAATLGSQLATIIEGIWSKVQAFAMADPADPVEIPDVVCITGSGRFGSAKRFSVRLAHIRFDTWARDEAEGRMHELFVSGESFGIGAEDVLISVLHEATHVVNFLQGKQDTTRGGQYHSRQFLKAATRFGLEWAHEGGPSDNQGFSDVTLSDFGRIFWADELAQLELQIKATASIKAGRLVKLHPDDPKDPRWVVEPVDAEPAEQPAKAPKRTRREYRCGCGFTVRMYPDDLELSGPTCGKCDQAFA